MEFEWDASKNEVNVRKHGINFEAAKFIFAGPLVERIDRRRNYGEQRIITIGSNNGIVMVVVYTWRGDRLRLISARKANDGERRAYHQALAGLDRS
jgi:uncharacterized protein